MLTELENAILARLEPLRKSVSRLVLRSYGGELSDGDLLAEVLSAGTAVLVTVPKAKFERHGARRWRIDATVRLIIGVRQPRGEVETRHGNTVGSIGSYGLWQQCLGALTGWSPLTPSKALAPSEFANLVNGKDQAHYLSVVGQSFESAVYWDQPAESDGPPISSIDLNHHLIPDDGITDATDHLEL